MTNDKLVFSKEVIEDENLKKLVKTYLSYTPSEEKLLDAACQVIWSHVLRNSTPLTEVITPIVSEAIKFGEINHYACVTGEISGKQLLANKETYIANLK